MVFCFKMTNNIVNIHIAHKNTLFNAQETAKFLYYFENQHC